ncbi:TAXI family TRAP transporter solute-binding subunit [Pelagibacterium lacus]|uniref:C4-dicarboxylate ABC transporter substrate-binding protein n=1 Tax=Pelagibacterium lacus TaxID=2282655 RepID=A0A369VZ78_9HYPH|nr:TAXI family TRAP transporter solute-binding subunit [Pelagibacterium lacus]RDE07704.1 hypothetical protein DVH29_15310 [Pelagibacterium lacus]
MMKVNRLSKLLGIAMLSAGLTVVSVSGAAAQQRMTIGTASSGGVFFPLGTGMAEVLSQEVEGVSFSAESTGGSAENARLVGSGGTSMGLAMADVAYYARQGLADFEDEGAYEDLRGVMMIYTQMMHLIVPANSDIETMADLEGRRVSPGPAGSGTSFMTDILLDAYGLKDSVSLDLLTHDQQASALGDGRIDAAFMLFPPGGAAVEAYANAHQARFIPIDDPDITSTLQEEYPFYAPTPIPAGSYTGQDEAVPSIGVSVVLVAHKDLDEDVIFDVTRVLNEHPERLAAYHSIAASMTTDNALNGMPVELHAGAERYYREVNHPGLTQ